MTDKTFPEAFPNSYRDPSGFVFQKEGLFYRFVSSSYAKPYQHLMSSGLYKELTQKNLLVSHQEIEWPSSHQAHQILKPTQIPFLSYPFEWSFHQLKRAALAVLSIQKTALQHDMTLKDSPANNMQFIGQNPLWIDTLSFEFYKEGEPWAAYGQFCRHFLAPLALMAFYDLRIHPWIRFYRDGIPLDLASKTLPKKTWLKTGLLLHIHAHAKSVTSFDQKKEIENTKKNRKKSKQPNFSRSSFLGLLDSLEKTIKALNYNVKNTSLWSSYVEETKQSEVWEIKQKALKGLLQKLQPETVWDFGANTGVFSQLAASYGASLVVAFEQDPVCVELHEQELEKQPSSPQVLSLYFDLINPSPKLGWENKETLELKERGSPDVLLSLALLHHLALGSNLPLAKIVSFYASLQKSGQHLIMEFVSKEDERSQQLLAWKGDLFPEYNQKHFEEAFSFSFLIEQKEELSSSRTLYLMQRK